MEHLTNHDLPSDLFAEELTPIAAPVAHTDTTQPADPDMVERAVLLFGQAGWTYKGASDTEALFLVRSPEGQSLVVFVADQDGSFCSCSDFIREKTCVHLLAIEQEVAFLAWVDAQELLPEAGEHPLYGTDPGFHYDRAADAGC